MSKGKDAMVGSRSLCLHRRFNTSSAKPRKIMQQMARRAPISCTNWRHRRTWFKNKYSYVIYNSLLCTSSWGKPIHWSPTKQLRKGTGMKQNRIIKKTVPLMTPWDSGLSKDVRYTNSKTLDFWFCFVGYIQDTYTSFLDVLLRSIPYNLADIKWSLKVGISLMVAKQPNIDKQQFITNGKTGTGDMLASILSASMTTQISNRLLMTTLPKVTIDFDVEITCHSLSLGLKIVLRFRFREEKNPVIRAPVQIFFHSVLLTHISL